MSAPTALTPARTTAPVPTGRVAELRELSRTTPGVLIVFTLAAVLASVLVGLFTAVSVQSRAQTLDDLAQRSGPLSVAAQDIYRSLSDADATANSAFLSGGQEPANVRARYESDIAQAEAALAVAVAAREPSDVVDPKSPLAVLSGKLSVYTGLVETARANNHQGLPVGAAYQREASHLMSTQLLPAAERLYNAEVAGRSDDQDSAGSSRSSRCCSGWSCWSCCSSRSGTCGSAPGAGSTSGSWSPPAPRSSHWCGCWSPASA